MHPKITCAKNQFTICIIGCVLFMLSGCGTQAIPAIVEQPTGLQPSSVRIPLLPLPVVMNTVSPISTATLSASVTTSGMPGMSMPTAIPSASTQTAMVTGSSGPTPTDFVIDWILFGTPTSTLMRVGMQATTNAPTDVAATVTPTIGATSAVSPTRLPTLTPVLTATHATDPVNVDRSAGDPAQGKVVFTGAGTCFACHDTSSGNTIVGPSLKGVASRAGSRKPGMSAMDYLRESILSPNAYIVSGFQPGVMPQTLGQTLTSQQINDVIAYLLTLK